MTRRERMGMLVVATQLALLFAFAPAVAASRPQGSAFRIQGWVRANHSQPANILVRLVYRDGLRPISQTYTTATGEFEFQNLMEGDFYVDTEETSTFQPTRTLVQLRELSKGFGAVGHVVIQLPLKAAATRTPVGVVAADVDLDVPEAARKRYDSAMEAIGRKELKRAVEDLKEAIKLAPSYYSARLELGRQLRYLKKFDDADEALKPLEQIAPKRAEPRIERGIALLGMGRREEAAKALRSALEIEETNAAAHLYLGWALIDVRDEEAEPHFWRALKLNEREAAQAHLALARLAHKYGYTKEAVEQLDAYLAISPNAPDAAEVRRLAESLRKKIK